MATDKKEAIGFPVGFKVRLRTLEMGDAEQLCSWMNNPEVTQYLSRNTPISLAQEQQWVETLPSRKDDFVFGIETLEGGKLIGDIGLHDVARLHGTASTGTVIGEPEFWGGGYGTDAKMLLLDFAFNFQNLRKIKSRVYDFNGRSLAYAAKCGYVEEGRLIREVWKAGPDGGRYVDVVQLAVFREDWLPLWQHYRTTGTVLKR
jgi:RimJ/RimL family protein N-acetyltransferase